MWHKAKVNEGYTLYLRGQMLPPTFALWVSHLDKLRKLAFIALVSFVALFLFVLPIVHGQEADKDLCVYYSVPQIRSNTSMDVVKIEPWSSNFSAPDFGTQLGYKITVRNNDPKTVATRIKATVLIDGWPYTWETEKTLLGGYEIHDFTNAIEGRKFGNGAIPLIVTFYYSDRVSTVIRYCMRDPVFMEGWYLFSDRGWYPFAKQYKINLGIQKAELVSYNDLYESKSSSAFASKTEKISSNPATGALIFAKSSKNILNLFPILLQNN